MGVFQNHNQKSLATPLVLRLRTWGKDTATFCLYALLLILANAGLGAQSNSVENSYKDAQKLFEQRDFASRQKAITILERNLKTNPEHLQTQALLGFAYAHDANLLRQLGNANAAKDYLTSAEAFAKIVLAKQPNNPYAKKTMIFLQLINETFAEATKLIGKEVTEQETDPDLWYMQAILSDGEKTTKSLAKALALKPDHVWIYSDLALRAVQLNNLPVAEKWIAALEMRAPNAADVHLLKAIIAAHKKDKKEMQLQWATFSQKASDSPVITQIISKVTRSSP